MSFELSVICFKCYCDIVFIFLSVFTTACSAGFYGPIACANTCGQCLTTPCDNNDGSCPGGACNPGYTGVKCDQCEYTYMNILILDIYSMFVFIWR